MAFSKNLRFITLLAWMNFIIVGTYVVDTFLLNPKEFTEIFTESSGESTRSRYGGGHMTYFLRTASDKKYQVPEEVYVEISNTRGTFQVRTTRIFNSPLSIQYTFEGIPRSFRIGLINTYTTIKIIVIFIMIASVLNLTRTPVTKHESFNQISVMLASLLMLIVSYMFLMQ